ncbi:hypothetical protein [Pseudomonas extremaustralis]
MSLEAKAVGDPDCGRCHKCLSGKIAFVALGAIKIPVTATRMILCPACGCKRCPKASDCQLDCTDSNDPGQPGSVYGVPREPNP